MRKTSSKRGANKDHQPDERTKTTKRQKQKAWGVSPIGIYFLCKCLMLCYACVCNVIGRLQAIPPGSPLKCKFQHSVPTYSTYTFRAHTFSCLGIFSCDTVSGNMAPTPFLSSIRIESPDEEPADEDILTMRNLMRGYLMMTSNMTSVAQTADSRMSAGSRQRSVQEDEEWLRRVYAEHVWPSDSEGSEGSGDSSDPGSVPSLISDTPPNTPPQLSWIDTPPRYDFLDQLDNHAIFMHDQVPIWISAHRETLALSDQSGSVALSAWLLLLGSINKARGQII